MPKNSPRSARGEAFLAVVKETPCLACGRYGVDIAHVKPWSAKTDSFTRRTHVGSGWFFAIPLCRRCHSKQTASNEDEWLAQNVDGGLDAVYAWIAKAVSIICGTRFDLSCKTAECFASSALDALDACKDV